MPRETKRYPAMNPPGLEPDQKPPVPAEAGAKQPAPEGGPSPREQAVTPEELSVEKLKAELFAREVPEE